MGASPAIIRDLEFATRRQARLSVPGTGWATGVRAALLSRDGGEAIPLSAVQLDAFAQDPDVEII